MPGTDSVRSYVLDGLGNWRQTAFTPVSPPTAQTEVRQHNGLNQITRRQNGSAQTNPTYDKNGNLTWDGDLTYSWDALNRLVAADISGGAAYVYDALNRRIRKTVSGTTDCIYSGWRCVEDRNVSNVPSVQYIWGIYLDELLQMNTYVPTGSQSLAAGTYYPLTDLLYRTTALTSSSGSIVEAYDTDAYGNTLIFTAVGSGSSWWDPDAVQAGFPACPYIFTGQRFDGETGLYYYKRRYYSPVLGRFASRDPVDPRELVDELIGALLYSYANENPVVSADPGGEASSQIGGVALPSIIPSTFIPVLCVSVVRFPNDIQFPAGVAAVFSMSGDCPPQGCAAIFRIAALQKIKQFYGDQLFKPNYVPVLPCLWGTCRFDRTVRTVRTDQVTFALDLWWLPLFQRRVIVSPFPVYSHGPCRVSVPGMLTTDYVWYIGCCL